MRGEKIVCNNPEVYIKEFLDVKVIGENSFVLTSSFLLREAIYNDARTNYRYGAIKGYNSQKVLIEYTDNQEYIEEGIFLIGWASGNYFHLVFEILPRLQYVDNLAEFDCMPIIVDQVVINTPQYSELLKIANINNRPIIAIEKNKIYSVGRIIYPMYNTWLPINLKVNSKHNPNDFRLSLTAINFFRSKLLVNRCLGSGKLFLAKKENSRLINEKEVSNLFARYGYDVVLMDDYEVNVQIDLFSNASHIVGVTGASFTNIIYCQEKTKIACIIPEEYDIYLFSTIAKHLELDYIHLDAKVVSKSSFTAGDKFLADLEYCEEFLINWDIC